MNHAFFSAWEGRSWVVRTAMRVLKESVNFSCMEVQLIDGHNCSGPKYMNEISTRSPVGINP